MTRFEVEFDGWFEVMAENKEEAFTRVFDLLNQHLSPLCDGGRHGDWEVTSAEPLLSEHE